MHNHLASRDRGRVTDPSRRGAKGQLASVLTFLNCGPNVLTEEKKLVPASCLDKPEDSWNSLNWFIINVYPLLLSQQLILLEFASF